MTCYRAFTCLTRLPVRIVFRPRVSGRERIPLAGGFVLSANHLSGFDSFAIAQALGSRSVRSMAKNELFARPLLGRLICLLGAFPARSAGPLSGGVERAAELAASGAVVVIFPAGTRRRKATGLRPRTGAARAALAADVPLVPVALRGTDGWRRLRGWSVAVGHPIPLHDLPEEPVSAAREATRRLWQAIGELEAALDPETGPSTGRASLQQVAPGVAGSRR